MNRRYFAVIALLLAFITLFEGCGTKYLYGDDSYYGSDNWDSELSVLNGKALDEDKAVYENDNDSDVVYLYLTVENGYNKQLGKSYNFETLKTYTDSDLVSGEEPFCNVIMREGTQNSSYGASLFGFGETAANAKLTIKGSTNKIKTRSFQLKLFDSAGLWHGVRTVNLIKDTKDLSRMKQKFCFDSIEQIENIAGMRTSFVRLFVQDTTASGELAYEDMGLFTYIEQPNKKFLEAHGLDTGGTMYRAENFNFSRYGDAIVDVDSPSYNEAKFEEYLNIRQGDSHEKLIEMLDAVNDGGKDIDDIVGKYFNEENLLTYAAVNVMFANIDSYKEDYILYSPQNSSTWYIFPSSFKNAFANSDINGEEIPQSEIGYTFLQNNVLFDKYFAKQGNKEKLTQKIDELRKIITDDFTSAQTELYKKAILKYVYSVPEINMLPRSADYVEKYIDSFSDMVNENCGYSQENSALVLAPYIVSYSIKDEKAILNFRRSTKAGLTYKLELSTTPDFKSVFYTSDELSSYTVTTSALTSDVYARIACSDGINTLYSSNISKNADGDAVYGCIRLEREW